MGRWLTTTYTAKSKSFCENAKSSRAVHGNQIRPKWIRGMNKWHKCPMCVCVFNTWLNFDQISFPLIPSALRFLFLDVKIFSDVFYSRGSRNCTLYVRLHLEMLFHRSQLKIWNILTTDFMVFLDCQFAIVDSISVSIIRLFVSGSIFICSFLLDDTLVSIPVFYFFFYLWHVDGGDAPCHNNISYSHCLSSLICSFCHSVVGCAGHYIYIYGVTKSTPVHECMR